MSTAGFRSCETFVGECLLMIVGSSKIKRFISSYILLKVTYYWGPMVRKSFHKRTSCWLGIVSRVSPTFIWPGCNGQRTEQKCCPGDICKTRQQCLATPRALTSPTVTHLPCNFGWQKVSNISKNILSTTHHIYRNGEYSKNCQEPPNRCHPLVHQHFPRVGPICQVPWSRKSTPFATKTSFSFMKPRVQGTILLGRVGATLDTFRSFCMGGPFWKTWMKIRLKYILALCIQPWTTLATSVSSASFGKNNESRVCLWPLFFLQEFRVQLLEELPKLAWQATNRSEETHLVGETS